MTEYKINENTSFKELKDILNKSNKPGDIFFCENDKVFDFVIKFMDDQRDSLISKLRLSEVLKRN